MRAVFSFGLRQTFSFWAPKSRWLLRMGRMLGFLPMMFFGMWGLPLGPPKPCQYTNVVSIFAVFVEFYGLLKVGLKVVINNRAKKS